MADAAARTVTPEMEAVVSAAKTIKDANPDMGLAKVHKAVKDANPTWLVGSFSSSFSSSSSVPLSLPNYLPISMSLLFYFFTNLVYFSSPRSPSLPLLLARTRAEVDPHDRCRKIVSRRP